MGCSPCKNHHSQVLQTKIKPGMWFKNEFKYWYQVFDFLEFEELIKISVVCKAFYKQSAHYSVLAKFKRKSTKQETLVGMHSIQDTHLDTEFILNSTPKFIFSLNGSLKSSYIQIRDSTELPSLRIVQNNPEESLHSLVSLSSFRPFSITKIDDKDSWGESVDFRMNKEIEELADMSTTDSKLDILKDLTQIHKQLWKCARKIDITGFTHYLDMLDEDYRTQDFLDFSYGNDSTTLLALACITGSTDFLTFLLSKLPKLDPNKGYITSYKQLNSLHIFKKSPLQLACARGLHKIVSILLNFCSLSHCGYSSSEFSSILTHTDLGVPPIIICISSKYRSAYLKMQEISYEIDYTDKDVDYTECIRLLCEKGADVNVEIENRECPRAVFYCIQNVDIMKILIEHGAEVNVINDKGYTPLYVLSEQCDKVAGARVLVENGGKVNPESCRPLYAALHNRNMNVAMYLKECGADINGDENTPSALQVAVSINDPYICKLVLLWKDLKIDWTYRQSGKNMFHRIAHNKGHSVLSALTSSRRFEAQKIKEALNSSTYLDGSIGDTTPLYYALPDIPLLQLMISKGADITRLNFARCFHEFLNEKFVVQYLLAKKCNLEDKYEGRTALWWAYEKCRMDYFNLLVKYGADINSYNDAGCLILHDACLKGSVIMVESLLKLGANINLKCSDGKDAEYYIDAFYPCKTQEISLKLKQMIHNSRIQNITN